MLSEKVVHYNYAKQKHAPRPVRVSEENVKTSVKLGIYLRIPAMTTSTKTA